MIMEYNNLLFRRRFPLRWGMKECLVALRKLELSGPPYDNEQEFHHSFFLATHIVYALGAYSAIKTHVKDAPWLYHYLRISMKYWMRQAGRRRKALVDYGGNEDDGVLVGDKFVYVDIDGVAENIDVFRGLGLTDASDRMVCER